MKGKCFVPAAKVRDYLLDSDHKDGAAKSVFFEAHGFKRAEHARLAEALVIHFEDNEPAAIVETMFGRKYIIQGPLEAADGRRPTVRSAWIQLEGDDIATFVTAIPR